jgi:hypothetical protein
MADSNDNLTNMIDQLIDDNSDQAKQSFHDYLKPKLQQTVTPNDDNSTTEE